jgi:hypothetical protein
VYALRRGPGREIATEIARMKPFSNPSISWRNGQGSDRRVT